MRSKNDSKELKKVVERLNDICNEDGFTVEIMENVRAKLNSTGEELFKPRSIYESDPKRITKGDFGYVVILKPKMKKWSWTKVEDARNKIYGSGFPIGSVQLLLAEK